MNEEACLHDSHHKLTLGVSLIYWNKVNWGFSSARAHDITEYIISQSLIIHHTQKVYIHKLIVISLLLLLTHKVVTLGSLFASFTHRPTGHKNQKIWN